MPSDSSGAAAPAQQTLVVRPRNDRVVAWALGAIALGVFAIWIVRPVILRWQTRESDIHAAREQLSDVQQLLVSQAAVDSMSQVLEQRLIQQPQRVLQAKSRPLAASALQSLVLELAESSNVSVARLDVANTDGVNEIPFELSANGDIYGLADLLQRIRTARFVVIVRKLQVQNNSALRGAPDVLQVVLSLAAPVIVP